MVLGLAANLLAAALLAFTIVFYAVVYSMWLKRATAQNIVIGGAAGALPPVIGQAVVTGSVGIESLILFAIIFIWTPPHFWALALIKADEYARAGIPMMPNVAGPASTRRQIVWYSLFLAPLGLVPVALGFGGLLYAVIGLVGGVGMIAFSIRVLRNRHGEAEKKRAAMGMFGFSILYLFALFSALLAEQSFGLFRPVLGLTAMAESRGPAPSPDAGGGGAAPQAVDRHRVGARCLGAALLRVDDRQARTADPQPADVRRRMR